MIRHRRVFAAFTLIELLTVVAVVAVLASILVPAAVKLRGPARRTMCADNMRQLMAAVLSYANDNAGKGPMRGYFTYTVAEPPREAVGPGGRGSPELDLQGTLGRQAKLLVNLGPLYRKWIGGRHDMLYCPSFYDVRDATWTYGGGAGNGGGWKSAFVSYYECYWTHGAYNYGIPLSGKSSVGGQLRPPRSPDFSGANPFPPDVWAAGLNTWIQDTWQPRNPGKTFKVPNSPALAFDPWIGGFVPRHNGGMNVMYTDGHVRFHDIGGLVISSGISMQFEVWYQLSLKQ